MGYNQYQAFDHYGQSHSAYYHHSHTEIEPEHLHMLHQHN